MYILEKRILGTQISMLGFKELQGTTLLCFAFSTKVPKTAQKTVQSF